MQNEPTEKWHADVFKYPPDMKKWDIAGGGFVWEDEYLTDTARKMEYGPLFVYLFRRFGPSEWGSDDHKSIAGWFLTTPNPDVILWVTPCVYGGKYSFGYGVHIDKYNDRRNEQQRCEVVAAMQATMQDLLSPVFVRDTAINALGRVADDAVGEDVVSPFKWAGYGVEHDYFEQVLEEQP